MADISQEIDQLRNAVYGEEVRGAFISCMQKIHEENESYNGIKSEVEQAAETVKNQVGAINTKAEEVQAALDDLAEAISNGKKQQSALEEATKNGKIQQSATEKATADGKAQQSATEKATADGKVQQTALQKVVDSAQKVPLVVVVTLSGSNGVSVSIGTASCGDCRHLDNSGIYPTEPSIVRCRK